MSDSEIRCTVCGAKQEVWDLRHALGSCKSNDVTRETIEGLVKQSEDTMRAVRDNAFLRSDWKLQRRFIDDLCERLGELTRITSQFVQAQNKKAEEQ